MAQLKTMDQIAEEAKATKTLLHIGTKDGPLIGIITGVSKTIRAGESEVDSICVQYVYLKFKEKWIPAEEILSIGQPIPTEDEDVDTVATPLTECPICKGKKTLPAGSYQVPMSGDDPEICRKCQGLGFLR